MRVNVLSSGSKGNTTYIDAGNTRILVDCGNTCKYVMSKFKDMGIDSKSLDAILITHTHIDHVKGACCRQAVRPLFPQAVFQPYPR